jgi:hypothetical protein
VISLGHGTILQPENKNTEMNSSLRLKRRMECESQRVSIRIRDPESVAAAQEEEVNSRRQPAAHSNAANNETMLRTDVPMISLPSEPTRLPRRVEPPQPPKSRAKKQNRPQPILIAITGPGGRRARA